MSEQPQFNTRQWSTLERVVSRFEESWIAGRPESIDDFLTEIQLQDSPVNQRRLLVELVHVELHRRLGDENTVRIEQYLERFPELTDDLRTILELAESECRSRSDQPTIQEYRRRFPELIEWLTDEWFAANRPQTGADTQDRSIDSSRNASRRTGGKGVELQPGARWGKYQIERLLDRGAFGAVYLARDLELDRNVALKIPHAKSLDEEERARLFREARSAASLQDDNICTVFDVGSLGDRPFIAMQYIDGETLAQWIQRGHRFSSESTARFVRQLAKALDTAHRQNVVHRDLKPANILIDQRDGRPVVTDFGLARRQVEGETQLTQTGQMMGTPLYMSPEQVRGDHQEVGPQSDIYSLGVVLYQMLAGRCPFLGSIGEVNTQILRDPPQPPSKFEPDIDEALESICLKAMNKSPQDRYDDMGQMADALTEYLEARATSPRHGETARGRLRPSMRMGLTVGLPVVASAAVVWAVLSWVSGNDKSDVPTRASRGESIDKFANLCFRDAFDDSQITEKNWEFFRPVVTKISHPNLEIPDVRNEYGRLILVNRGYLTTRREFPRGVSVEFRWMWTDGKGTYCDDLTIGLRTSGAPRLDWPHEMTTGLGVRFSPQDGKISISEHPGHRVIASGQGVRIDRNEWHKIRVTDDGQKIEVFVDDLQKSVLRVKSTQQGGGRRVSFYNREPVGGINKESVLDDVEIREPPR